MRASHRTVFFPNVPCVSFSIFSAPPCLQRRAGLVLLSWDLVPPHPPAEPGTHCWVRVFPFAAPRLLSPVPSSLRVPSFSSVTLQMPLLGTLPQVSRCVVDLVPLFCIFLASFSPHRGFRPPFPSPGTLVFFPPFFLLFYSPGLLCSTAACGPSFFAFLFGLPPPPLCVKNFCVPVSEHSVLVPPTSHPPSSEDTPPSARRCADSFFPLLGQPLSCRISLVFSHVAENRNHLHLCLLLLTSAFSAPLNYVPGMSFLALAISPRHHCSPFYPHLSASDFFPLPARTLFPTGRVRETCLLQVDL